MFVVDTANVWLVGQALCSDKQYYSSVICHADMIKMFIIHLFHGLGILWKS